MTALRSQLHRLREQNMSNRYDCGTRAFLSGDAVWVRIGGQEIEVREPWLAKLAELCPGLRERIEAIASGGIFLSAAEVESLKLLERLMFPDGRPKAAPSRGFVNRGFSR
jgi:hypothetical protein